MKPTKTFVKDDEYMTPLSAWEDITQYIPKDKVIWEPFYGDGQSGAHLEQLGCKKVIHQAEDFFQHNHGEVIVTNPPFTQKQEVFARLKLLGKPFILICPATTVCTHYFRDVFRDSVDPIQLIVPKGRIQFQGAKRRRGGNCNFECFYYCWKMNLPRDLVWLS